MRNKSFLVNQEKRMSDVIPHQHSIKEERDLDETTEDFLVDEEVIPSNLSVKGSDQPILRYQMSEPRLEEKENILVPLALQTHENMMGLFVKKIHKKKLRRTK